MERCTLWTGKEDAFMSSLCIIQLLRSAIHKCTVPWKRTSIKFLLFWHSYNLYIKKDHRCDHKTRETECPRKSNQPPEKAPGSLKPSQRPLFMDPADYIPE